MSKITWKKVLVAILILGCVAAAAPVVATWVGLSFFLLGSNAKVISPDSDPYHLAGVVINVPEYPNVAFHVESAEKYSGSSGFRQVWDAEVGSLVLSLDGNYRTLRTVEGQKESIFAPFYIQNLDTRSRYEYVGSFVYDGKQTVLKDVAYIGNLIFITKFEKTKYGIAITYEDQAGDVSSWARQQPGIESSGHKLLPPGGGVSEEIQINNGQLLVKPRPQ